MNFLYILTTTLSLMLLACGHNSKTPQTFALKNDKPDSSGLAMKYYQPSSPEEYRQIIRRSQILIERPENPDYKRGPEGGFWPTTANGIADLECQLVPFKPKGPNSGKTPKFKCRFEGQKLKVKYHHRNPNLGPQNHEVFAEVAASRLMWGIGFAADRVYPATVDCQGCTADPFGKALMSTGSYYFDLASIELKFPGKAVELRNKKDGTKIEGWRFSDLLKPEFLSPDKKELRKQVIDRQALILFASMLQHADSKADNQRLVCSRISKARGKPYCEKPYLVWHDLGATFAKGFSLAKPYLELTKMNIDDWSNQPIFNQSKKVPACTTHIRHIPRVAALLGKGSTLYPTQISEEAVTLLYRRLDRIKFAQLKSIFQAARTKELNSQSTPSRWTEATLTKIAELKEVLSSKICPKVQHQIMH